MTLGESGQILVTQAAARQYADARGLGVEEARRELTTLHIYIRCAQHAWQIKDGDKR